MRNLEIEKLEILTIKNKAEEKFLRHPAKLFDFFIYRKKEIRELIKIMRRVMKDHDGVGLSANQLGIDRRVFVAQVNNKFYIIFNPVIVEYSHEMVELEEGCLSIPGVFAGAKRPAKVTLTGRDQNGKKLKIKAWGLLARVFQHEVDHLNGRLFIDLTKVNK